MTYKRNQGPFLQAAPTAGLCLRLSLSSGQARGLWNSYLLKKIIIKSGLD